MLPILKVSYHTLQSLEDTLFTLVDTPEALCTMVPKLQGAAEIAVDLEHHSYRYTKQLASAAVGSPCVVSPVLLHPAQQLRLHSVQVFSGLHLPAANINKTGGLRSRHSGPQGPDRWRAGRHLCRSTGACVLQQACSFMGCCRDMPDQLAAHGSHLCFFMSSPARSVSVHTILFFACMPCLRRSPLPWWEC